MICSNCGSFVDNSKKHCNICGYPVQQAAEADLDAVLAASGASDYAHNGTDTLVNDFVINAATVRSQPATPAEHSNITGFEEKPKKKKRKMLLVPVIAVVLAAVIALCAWGIFFAFNH